MGGRGRSRAGCSQQMGGQRRPLSRLSEVWMVEWKAGRLVGECTNEHGCSLKFLTKPCLASFPLWLSSVPCQGFLPIIDTEALWEGRTWVEGAAFKPTKHLGSGATHAHVYPPLWSTCCTVLSKCLSVLSRVWKTQNYWKEFLPKLYLVQIHQCFIDIQLSFKTILLNEYQLSNVWGSLYVESGLTALNVNAQNDWLF